MLESFRLLRFKLTLYYISIFGALQVLLWVVVSSVVARHLHQRFDLDLLQRGQTLAEAFDTYLRRYAEQSFRQRAQHALEPFQSDNVFIQLRSLESDELVKSHNLRGFALPIVPVDTSGERAPEWRTLRNDTTRSLTGSTHPLRLASLYLEPSAGGSPYHIELAASLAPLERTVLLLQQLMIVCILGSIVTAAIISWLLARRSLAPIDQITRQARRLSAGRLDQRIPSPRQRDEVGEMVDAINQMLARFEEQFKNQQQFISHVSHELKSPLAALLVDISSRRRDDQPPETVAFFDSAEQEVRRLLRTVEGFLILTRARGRRRMEMVTEVAIEDVLLGAIQNCSREARRRDVRVVPRFSPDPAAPAPIVSGDADLLMALVENLVNNAIRHSPQGQTVEVEATSTHKEVDLYVRDNGPGIPDEHLKRVFELFYQVNSQGSQTGKAGIGLAIVKAVVDLHGGTVEVTNRPSGGCEFRVRLPIVAAPTT